MIINYELAKQLKEKHPRYKYHQGIDYKLAKELKDAGFPQHQPCGSECYIPSLSELIEACGDDFENLVRTDEKNLGVWFRAYMTEDAFDELGIPCVRDCDGFEGGDTPEESVARLWLELNKK